MFYDRFCVLCEQKGISPSKAATECGFNRASVTNWKKNGYTPRQELLLKIADYFGVSVDYLLGSTDLQAADRSELTTADIKFALFGGDSEFISDEALEDVIHFAQIIAEKERQKNGINRPVQGGRSARD